MKPKSIDALFFVAAIIAGLIVSWIDLHATEVLPAISLLLIFGAILGFARSRSAWRWPIILGFTFFLGHLILPALGVKSIEPAQPNVFATSIGLIPAFIGTYVGVAAHEVILSVLKDDQK